MTLNSIRVWLIKILGGQEIAENNAIKKPLLFGKLMNYKMQELRAFGKHFNAYDTKKSELVEEIIEKAPIERIMKFIMR